MAEPITPVAVPDIFSVSRRFGEPISATETLQRHTGLLVADLCTALEKRGLGARMRLKASLHVRKRMALGW